MATGPHEDTGTVGRRVGTILGIPWGALAPKAVYRENAALHLRCVQRRGRQAVPRAGKMREGQGGWHQLGTAAAYLSSDSKKPINDGSVAALMALMLAYRLQLESKLKSHVHIS